MNLRLSFRILALAVALSPTFSAGSAQTPAPKPPPPKPPVRVRPDFKDFDISPQAGHSANQAGAVSRGGTASKLYAPALAKAYTTNPQFHWEAFDPGTKVTFHLMTADGTTIFEASTSGGHFDYPASAPALTPGSTYRWTVIPADDDIYSGVPTPVGFVVVSGQERAAIAAELAPLKDPAARAQVYVDHRLWYDAIQAYTALLDRHPDDIAARTLRAQLYGQFPVTKALADADWSRIP